MTVIQPSWETACSLLEMPGDAHWPAPAYILVAQQVWSWNFCLSVSLANCVVPSNGRTATLYKNKKQDKCQLGTVSKPLHLKWASYRQHQGGACVFILSDSLSFNDVVRPLTFKNDYCCHWVDTMLLTAFYSLPLFVVSFSLPLFLPSLVLMECFIWFF